MRFLFVAALVFFAPFAVAQQWEAAPLVGPWDYGENRCELRRYGYPTETAAVAAFGSEAPLEDRDGDGVPFVFDMRFPGQLYDAASGLNYNYFRDYEPGTGRYVESDPIGQRGGLATYGYANSSPFQNIDPLGLAIWICNRSVQGFPFVGNHSYLWDDKSKSSCGMQGSFGFGPRGQNERGPSVDSCNKVPWTDGVEWKIMKCCLDNANNGLWFPGLNDCHNAANDCVQESGFVTPRAPGGRIGDRCSGCK